MIEQPDTVKESLSYKNSCAQQLTRNEALHRTSYAGFPQSWKVRESHGEICSHRKSWTGQVVMEFCFLDFMGTLLWDTVFLNIL